MTTFAEVVGLKKVLKGTYGIEIETEVESSSDYPKDFFSTKVDPDTGDVGYEIPSKVWKAVEDHSLRNFGMEFILKKPLPYEGALNALVDFSKMTENINFIEDAPATSVHVHINMQEETVLTLANFITIFIQFENLLTEFSGDFRRSNNFAGPTRHVEGNIKYILEILGRIDRGPQHRGSFWAGSGITEGNCKYANLNIQPLTDKGSVEIRCFRGTANVDEITLWLGMIHNMLEYARQPGLTPVRFLSSLRGRELEVISEVFGDYGDHLKYPEYMNMIHMNSLYTRRISSCVKDWSVFGLKWKLPKSVKKKATADMDFEQFVAGHAAPPVAAPAWVFTANSDTEIQLDDE